jgi:hypothetical protein
MKFKSVFLLAFIIYLATAVSAVSAQKNKYVGYQHKGVVYGQRLPNGVKDLGGGLLSDENYGVSRFSDGKKQMLWLEKMISRDRKGIPNWEVLDVLAFNNLKKNQVFLLSYSSTCTQNGKENFDLIVLADLAPKTKIYKVLQAWTANLFEEKFVEIPTAGIKCDYIEP